MCGIAGIIDLSAAKAMESPINKMVKTMKHRGPDDEGVFLEDNVSLGFVRLSIIDLSVAGHQPKFSNDERFVIVFNGEVFNYLEIKTELELNGVVFKSKTDTEVLLNAYIHWGEDCLDRLNGMWAFAIYDRKTKNIFAARDRFGIKPFYYIHEENYFAFCSEIPPLLSLLKQKPKPNYSSVYDFLVFNRTDHTANTFFKVVKKLQHGTKLNIQNKKISFKKWYDLKENVNKTTGFKNAEEYNGVFSTAVRLQMRSDVPVGVCLSGGLDSSAILSVILKENLQKDPFTFSSVFGKDHVGDESEFIKEFAPYTKNMFFVTPTSESLKNDLDRFIACQAEPVPSTSAYAEFKVMELQKGKVVVSLSGQGADEALGGYDYFFGFYFKYLFKNLRFIKLISEVYHYLKIHKSFFAVKAFIYFLLPENVKGKVNTNSNDCLNSNFINDNKSKSAVSGNLYNVKNYDAFFFEHFEYKLEHHLIWSDRSSMNFSIESRVPFLDHNLVEKTLATKKEMIIKKGVSKFILRAALKDVLPEKIRKRYDKIGFETPEGNWFREASWQMIILEILNSRSFKERNLIDHKKALKKYREHLEMKVDISKEIWKWIHLELWFRKFID